MQKQRPADRPRVVNLALPAPLYAQLRLEAFNRESSLRAVCLERLTRPVRALAARVSP